MNGIESLARRAGLVAAPFIFLALLWQFAALVMPPFLFPSLADIFRRMVEILLSWKQTGDVLATVGRIMAGLAGAFILGASPTSFSPRS
jgi:ABC-type nitrate/sulfonate/bicarbonate transport system permease component